MDGQRSQRLGIVAAIVVVAAAAAMHWWPDDEARVTRRLRDLAEAATPAEREGQLAAAASAVRAAGYFTSNAVVRLGAGYPEIRGREQIRLVALKARQMLNDAEIVLSDIRVTIEAATATATAHLTGRVTGGNGLSRDVLQLNEFRVRLRKVDGEWLVDDVETVQTFE